MMASPAQVVGALGAAVDTAADLPVPESPQAQIDHLQKLVNALMQRMQDQEDAFELERLTWEAGDELHDEEEEEADPPKPDDPPKPVRAGEAAAAFGRFGAEPAFAEPSVTPVNEFRASRKCCNFIKPVPLQRRLREAACRIVIAS